MGPNELNYQYNQDQPNQPTFRSHLIDFIQTLVVFLAIGSFIYWQIAQPHKVSGLSMYPNFHNGDYIFTDKISFRFGDPQRGDVVVFKNPQDSSQDFIKRVMGLPGEKVKIQNGHVYIDDDLVQEPYLKTDLYTPAGAFLQEGQNVTVTPGSYIVLGDNRPNSSDSREWGLLPKEKLIGKVFLRYWPADTIGLYPAAHTFKSY